MSGIKIRVKSRFSQLLILVAGIGQPHYCIYDFFTILNGLKSGEKRATEG